MKETVKVSLTTQHQKDGRPKLVSARTIIQDVKYRYMDGRIATSSGDCWSIVPNPNKKESTYIAVQ